MVKGLKSLKDDLNIIHRGNLYFSVCYAGFEAFM